MPLLLSNFDPVLKDFWEGGIREQLNNEIPAWQVFEESDKQFSGRRAIYPIHTTRNSGVGARAENGTLPTAGNQGHELAVVSATYQYGRFRVSGQTIAAGKHAFAEAIAMEMDGLVRDCKVDWGRQTWGDGTGRLAQIQASATAGTGSTVVLVKNRFTTGEAQVGQPGARYISVGQVIDIGSIANDLADISQTVSAVTISQNPATTTDTVTLGNSAATFSSTESWLYNATVGTSGGIGREIMGLVGIADTFTQANMWGSNSFWSANLFGIGRSSVGAWNATVLGNSGTARIIDSYLMQQAFDQIHIDTGEEADLIFCHHAVARALFDNVVADRRYLSAVFDAGQKSLTYNGVPVMRDRLAQFNSMLVCKKSSIAKFTLKDVGFVDRDGAVLSRVADTDAFEGFLAYYGNMGVVGNMKSILMIRDIKTDL